MTAGMRRRGGKHAGCKDKRKFFQFHNISPFGLVDEWLKYCACLRRCQAFACRELYFMREKAKSRALQSALAQPMFIVWPRDKGFCAP